MGLHLLLIVVCKARVTSSGLAAALSGFGFASSSGSKLFL